MNSVILLWRRSPSNRFQDRTFVAKTQPEKSAGSKYNAGAREQLVTTMPFGLVPVRQRVASIIELLSLFDRLMRYCEAASE